MILPDVNVLVYAYREDAPRHEGYRAWLESSPTDHALQFAETLRAHPHCVRLAPGPRHWEIFARLCRDTGVKGNLVPDAYLAALAIETGSEWITTDHDYRRFRGLRCRHPLAPPKPAAR